MVVNPVGVERDQKMVGFVNRVTFDDDAFPDAAFQVSPEDVLSGATGLRR